jgi:predicted nucleic acid-binding protein
MSRVKERRTGYEAPRRILFDTSVIVPALSDAHPLHARATPWLYKVLARDVGMAISIHTMAETYSALTRLPISPVISGEQARWLVKDVILGTCRATVISLTADEYLDALERAAVAGVRGGGVHDSVIAQCARKATIAILTFNRRDFTRVVDPTTEILDP